MRTYSFHKAWVCRCAGRAFLLMGLLFLFPHVSQAEWVVVDCSGNTPGAFTSITAALNFLPINSPTEPHTITVTGTCTETVNIRNRQRITIEAPAGQTATITSAFPQQYKVVNIDGSRAITLRRLVIRNGNVGVWITRASEVIIQGSTMENNVTQGIRILETSNLNLDSSTITNNGAQGLRVDPNCYVMVGGGAAAQAVQITNNRGPGINADAGTISINGYTTIENNGGHSIDMVGGRLIVSGVQGENTFRSNRGGIFLNAASATFNGQNTIQNNAGIGIRTVGARIAFNEAVLPDGTLRVTVIDGHVYGLYIARESEVTFTGRHEIRNNGDVDPGNGAGVLVTRSSFSAYYGTRIVDNIGAGITAHINSLLYFEDITISNNTEEGVRVKTMSFAGIGVPSTIIGNGIASIACDLTSLLSGDLTGLANVDCKNIAREQGPPRPGHIH